MSPVLRKPGSAPGVTCSLLFAALLAAGCTDPRDEEPAGPTWEADIAPLLSARCTSCHSGESPEGDYSLDSYPELLEGGTDEVPNAIAGDPGSRLLTVLAEPGHQEFLADEPGAAELLRRWVVDERLAFFNSVVHPPGFVNPADPDFHGREIAEAGWDFSECQSCHGQNYAGGTARSSCLDCHPGSPEACSTCHGTGALGGPSPSLGSEEALGAHREHLRATTIAERVECNECHVVPETMRDTGHLDGDNRAEVTFGERASARGASPAYELTTRTCSDVACHGSGIEGGTVPEPVWNQGEEAGACGACHGLPPAVTSSGAPHPPVQSCEACHPTAGPALTIIQPELHVNGIVDVSSVVAGCSGCHSGPGDPLPFRDTSGNTTPTSLTVGAHDRHLAPGTFSDGVGCGDCHPVPASLGDPGHIDGPPAEVIFATGTGFDRTTLTCVAGCHGSDLAGGAPESPVWNDPNVEVVCGSCHEIPPPVLRSGAPHPPAGECGSCHGQVIDELFQWVNKSLHVNGQVETGGP